jgi:outer membrane lipoprotein SlyB
MRLSTRNKILPVALVAALLGGTVGAFVGRTSKTTDTTERSALASALTSDEASIRDNKSLTPEQSLTSDSQLTASNNVDPEYRAGFFDGFRAATLNDRTEQNRYSSSDRVVRNTRVVERPVYRTVNRASRNNSRQVYYDYDNQPRKRSFWQKHRDKLTVAAGTGGGALLGGLVGGKKGAIIGALAGAGGSALYTYKIRNRSRRY